MVIGAIEKGVSFVASKTKSLVDKVGDLWNKGKTKVKNDFIEAGKAFRYGLKKMGEYVPKFGGGPIPVMEGAGKIPSGGKNLLKDAYQYVKDTGERVFGSGEKDGVKEANVPRIKNTIPETTIKHADLGDFNSNNRLINGGHGQRNIEYLNKNNIEYHIVREYPNGVRIGNIPSHKNKFKKSGTGQAWFPESWSESKIIEAGNHVNSLPENKSLSDGQWAFAEYDGVRVGIIKNDGKVATIIPDNSKQP